MDLSVGTVIRGKYRIDNILGQGGMGVVVGAHHLALDQRVAIKFLLPAMLEHRAVVDRFAREARAASKIQSDHVARIMDVDSLEDGTPFMVMEYLVGNDLSKSRKTGQPLPIHVAVSYVIEACEAVAEAHRVGIVHRDLKPANLFLSQRPDGKKRVKVLDFGISKIAGADGEASVTSTSTVMGSAEYMSPEQMLSTKDADARSDIWALGVCLYELLTARVPFPGESLTQVCALVLQTQPSTPSALRPEIPIALNDLVMKCLEKDPARRFANVEHLATALSPFSDAGFVAANQGPVGQPTTDRIPGGAQPPQTPIGFGPPPQVVRALSSPEARSGLHGAQQRQQPRASSPQGFGPQGGGPDLPTAILGGGPQQRSTSSPGFGSNPSMPERTSHSQGIYASPSNPGTDGVFSSSQIGRRPSYAPLFAIAGVVSLMAVGTVVFFATRHHEPGAASGVVSTMGGVNASTQASTVGPIPTGVTVTTSTTTSPSTTATSTATSPSTPATATATARMSDRKPASDKPPVGKPAAAAPKPASTKNCSPPFTVDANGMKHAKPDCL